MTAPGVTFLVTAHNEAAHIGATVRHLLAQEGVPGGFEILLVDDASTDGTATAAREAAAGDARLRVIGSRRDPASPLTTRQQALDLGFAEARGEVVLLVDADSAMRRDWAARMAAPVLAGRADAAAGPVGFVPSRSWIARWQSCDAHYYFLVCRLLARAGLAAGVFFGNFAVRRAVHAELGGFSGIGFALTEDLAFAQALHAAGRRIAFLPGPGTRVDVHACPDFPSLVARSLRVTSGGPSVLAAVLTIWPLTLLGLLLAALVSGAPALWWAAGLRWLAGAGLVRLALRAHEDPRVRRFAWFYEPLAFVLAAAVLWRVARGQARIGWGGRNYER
ncbi:Glycosyltransferase like family 2 [Meinhardsimonia xiamenensis]|jgi:cellulose synthase/poly-beta-1,6-N-acetylglucosamine synthase-like glycosyltransferase|uniref:Glycosyltransferase like family 2 n=1 Tax=Meinhardsimonia xiamenensis TaxID=990712 RepID=A0A1G9FH35_9RHOB|nr:glycosyltransferase [Meinhardsimonia xiamenensis]PRX37850.1 glycosyl transferase family 2 [Meinhardsimonia xiamenensis]SDK87662.1 Glycosyltransferase like family 2 [Meinhardsimonia xiamenensis]